MSSETGSRRGRRGARVGVTGGGTPCTTRRRRPDAVPVSGTVPTVRQVSPLSSPTRVPSLPVVPQPRRGRRRRPASTPGPGVVRDDDAGLGVHACPTSGPLGALDGPVRQGRWCRCPDSPVVGRGREREWSPVGPQVVTPEGRGPPGGLTEATVVPTTASELKQEPTRLGVGGGVGEGLEEGGVVGGFEELGREVGASVVVVPTAPVLEVRVVGAAPLVQGLVLLDLRARGPRLTWASPVATGLGPLRSTEQKKVFSQFIRTPQQRVTGEVYCLQHSLPNTRRRDQKT